MKSTNNKEKSNMSNNVIQQAHDEDRASFAITQLRFHGERVMSARVAAAAKIAAATEDGRALSSFDIDGLISANAAWLMWRDLAAAFESGYEIKLDALQRALADQTERLLNDRHAVHSTSTASRAMGEADRAAAVEFVRLVGYAVQSLLEAEAVQS